MTIEPFDFAFTIPSRYPVPTSVKSTSYVVDPVEMREWACRREWGNLTSTQS